MQNREFDTSSKTKQSLSRQVVERQKDEHEARGARLPQRDPFASLISGIGDASSAGVHASMLNLATNGQPSRAGQSLLRLQRRYGNRYVQRVLALAGKGTGEAEVAPEVEQSIQQARGGGHGIDSRVRGQMESAFGADFGNVRLHTDTQADTLNRELNARAFTTGQDIFFRQGASNSGSSSGRELLAHELTHVVQQYGDKVQRKLTVGQPGDKYEQEADDVMKAIIQRLQRQGEGKDKEKVEHVQVKADDIGLQSQSYEEEEPTLAKARDSKLLPETEEKEEKEPIQEKASFSMVQRFVFTAAGGAAAGGAAAGGKWLSAALTTASLEKASLIIGIAGAGAGAIGAVSGAVTDGKTGGETLKFPKKVISKTNVEYLKLVAQFKIIDKYLNRFLKQNPKIKKSLSSSESDAHTTKKPSTPNITALKSKAVVEGKGTSMPTGAPEAKAIDQVILNMVVQEVKGDLVKDLEQNPTKESYKYLWTESNERKKSDAVGISGVLLLDELKGKTKKYELVLSGDAPLISKYLAIPLINKEITIRNFLGGTMHFDFSKSFFDDLTCSIVGGAADIMFDPDLHIRVKTRWFWDLMGTDQTTWLDVHIRLDDTKDGKPVVKGKYKGDPSRWFYEEPEGYKLGEANPKPKDSTLSSAILSIFGLPKNDNTE